MKAASAAFAGLALIALTACFRESMPDQRDGEKIYEANCETCHGIKGRGDGEIAVTMDPRPSDLSVLSRNNGGVFPTSAVLSKIDGYGADPDAQAAMPEFGALLDGDLVPLETEDGVLTPTPRKLAALVEYLTLLQR